MSVVLYHLQDYLLVKLERARPGGLISDILAYGYLGVPLFFVISGFIIARPFLDGSFPGAGVYFKRRLTRLEPPYIVNMILVWWLLVFVRGDDGIELLPHLVASLLYMHGIIFGSMSEINFVAWSLEVEFQFYVLAPIFLVPLVRRMVFLRVLLVWFLFVGCVNFRLMPAPSGFGVINYLGFFSAGILVSEVFVTRWGKRLPNLFRFDLVLLAGLVFLVLGHIFYVPIVDLTPLALGLVVLGGLGGRISSSFLSWPPLYLIGGMCYTIYLYHFLVISGLGRFLLPHLDATGPFLPDLVLGILVIVPAVLVFGALMFLLIERPFMAIGRRPVDTLEVRASKRQALLP